MTTMIDPSRQCVAAPAGPIRGVAELSAFHVWVNAGRSPFWGDLKIVSAYAVGDGRYDVVLEGDGFDLESMIRIYSDTFLMFEREGIVPSGSSAHMRLRK